MGVSGGQVLGVWQEGEQLGSTWGEMVQGVKANASKHCRQEGLAAHKNHLNANKPRASHLA